MDQRCPLPDAGRIVFYDLAVSPSDAGRQAKTSMGWLGPLGLDYPRQAPETLAIPGIRTAVLPLNLPQRFACWLHWNQAASSWRTTTAPTSPVFNP
jgi:hypothetical protein